MRLPLLEMETGGKHRGQTPREAQPPAPRPSGRNLTSLEAWQFLAQLRADAAASLKDLSKTSGVK